MSFTKVSEDIILHGGVTPLPDSPQLQPAALKAKFDEKGQAACETFNNFVDDIADPTKGALNIGATAPQGITSVANVQAILNTLAALVVVCEAERHTHDNKSVLDDIDVAYKAMLDDIAAAFEGVQSVATSSMNPTSTTEIPASSAVSEYFTDQLSTIRNAIFPVGCVVLTQNMNPYNLYGFGTWILIDTVKAMTAYTRTA